MGDSIAGHLLPPQHAALVIIAAQPWQIRAAEQLERWLGISPVAPTASENQ